MWSELARIRGGDSTGKQEAGSAHACMRDILHGIQQKTGCLTDGMFEHFILFYLLLDGLNFKDTIVCCWLASNLKL